MSCDVFKPGDSKANIIRKILECMTPSAGNVPHPDDEINTLWAKILRELGGTPLPCDWEYPLLRKILDIKAPGEYRVGDFTNTILRKILEAVAPGEWKPADGEMEILRKILDAGL